MEDILIGLFMQLLARFIKNPASAAKYDAELEHIAAGIDAIRVQLQSITGAKPS